MTSLYLKELVLANLGIKNIHPLHSLMLDECCETVLTKTDNEGSLIETVLLSFWTANSLLVGLLKGNLENAETVTLNYRNEQFLFNKQSSFLGINSQS